MQKIYGNPENGCRPECTNFHPDICKYSRKLRKCYNVNCYRIHLKGTMRTRSPQVQQHALSRPWTNQFHNAQCPATLPFKTNLTKPPVPITLLTLPASLLVPTLIPRTQFFPTPTPWLRATPTQTPSNPHHQDTISVGSTLPCNHPPTLHNTTTRKSSQLQKSNRIQMINTLFYSKKIMNLQHQLDNTGGANGSSKKRKQVYLGKTRINQWLLTKYKDGHKQHNRSQPTKITITCRDNHQQYKQLQPARTIRTAKGSNNQQHLILHRYLRHHHLLQQKWID